MSEAKQIMNKLTKSVTFLTVLTTIVCFAVNTNEHREKHQNVQFIVYVYN